MITFFVALYVEAEALIEQLGLKKNTKETIYSLYENETCRLVLTGCGTISAAAAVSRHFSLYPAAPDDLVVNLGTAGYLQTCDRQVHPSAGDVFFASKITDSTTTRTYYPDVLFRLPFPLCPLVTVPRVMERAPEATENIFTENTLIDMEASGIYPVLLSYVSPERMFFVKVVSDFITETGNIPSADTISKLIQPHLTALLDFLREVQAGILQTPVSFTPEEEQLKMQLFHRLPLTETMRLETGRLLSYVKLTGTPLCPLLEEFLQTLPKEAIRGKKQAAPHLERLRKLILQKAPVTVPAVTISSSSVFAAPFETVYAEEGLLSAGMKENSSNPLKMPYFDLLNLDLTNKNLIKIKHYKDVFNRSHQNFSLQKNAPSLILAKKTGTLIYHGAPVCQSFGNEHFYYTSCMMNCIYHCDYCYLQGMYPSGHVVVFVNLEDYFEELKHLLRQHPVYLCVSYDTDLLPLEKQFGFISKWLKFALTQPKLTLEIRTKSGNPAVFRELSRLYPKELSYLKERVIFAWTVSPAGLSEAIEHGAASLTLRLKALQAAHEEGFSVRLCFDPMIYHAGWKATYRELVETIASTLSFDLLYDVSIGVFRISTEYLKNMRKKRPDSAIVQFPYITQNGVSHYGDISDEMISYMKELLQPFLPDEKIFIWNGGTE